MWIFGGLSIIENKLLKDFWAFDFELQQWEKINFKPRVDCFYPEPLCHHSMTPVFHPFVVKNNGSFKALDTCFKEKLNVSIN